MKIYDTLTAKMQEISNKDLSLYCCGPTVYNYIHIGNSRPIITTDLLIKFLKQEKYNINYLLNITDIDDKIVNKALQEGVSEEEIAQKYTKHFLDDLRSLNVQEPSKIIPISSKMNEILTFIEELIMKGFAYEVDGDVYFDVEKSKNNYGKLSKQKIEELIEAERTTTDVKKRNPSDFVLWKKTLVGIKFDTKWSKGRPGWHTECAVLINDYFTNNIDIHLGGIDLKFPHHENERIQYIAANNKELSKCWMHIGHLNMNGEKMSKSLGNTILLKDFIKKYGPNVLRYLTLSTRYRQPININEELILDSIKWNEKIYNVLNKINWSSNSELIKINKNINKNYYEQFRNYMNDDLNTPMVISLIDEIIKNINIQLKTNEIDSDFKTLSIILDCLGMKYEMPKLSNDDIASIVKWQKFIKEKDFLKADLIRKTLLEKGLI